MPLFLLTCGILLASPNPISFPMVPDFNSILRILSDDVIYAMDLKEKNSRIDEGISQQELLSLQDS